MGLAREKNVKLSYTGKESKSRLTKAIERDLVLPLQESVKLSLGYAFSVDAYLSPIDLR